MRHIQLLLLLCPLSLTACAVHGEPDGETDGSSGGSDGASSDSAVPCDETEAMATSLLPSGITCEVPLDCISLPEAVDRGVAAISYTGSGLTLENVSDSAQICVDGWYMFMSGESQDSGAGDPGDDGGSDTGGGIPGIEDGADGTYEGSNPAEEEEDPCDDTEPPPPQLGGRMTLAPLEALTFTYGSSGAGLEPDTPTWWCVEETQSVAATNNFVFNGAHMPQPLAELALTETDVDGDGVEDHSDGLQTNYNIWAFQRENPVFSIGRDINYVELGPDGSQPVTLQITNMGRVGDSVMITETLPPGVEASRFSIQPNEIEVTPRGWTVLHFQAELSGSVDTPSDVHTEYATAEISYTVRLREGATCPLRHEGRAPTVQWDTSDARLWTSVGTGLIVSCCTE